MRGNPGHQKLNKREPQPDSAIPTRPGWLLPEAKREWNRIVPQLSALGLLTVLDRGAVAGGCQWWAMYVDAVKDIALNGTTYTTDTGYQGPRPSVGLALKSWQQYLAFCARFGLTPADRSRLSVPEKRHDELDDVLAQAEAVVSEHESERE